MDAKSGRIIELDTEVFRQVDNSGRKLIPLTKEDVEIMSPLSKNQRKNNMRNRPCICGSNKKFKKCCWNKYL